MSDYILPLDPSKRSTDTIDFQRALRSKIVGQAEGVQALWTCIRSSAPA